MAGFGTIIIDPPEGHMATYFDSLRRMQALDVTAHTIFDVPLHIVGTPFKGRALRGDRDAAGWFEPEGRAQRETNHWRVGGFGRDEAALCERRALHPSRFAFTHSRPRCV